MFKDDDFNFGKDHDNFGSFELNHFDFCLNEERPPNENPLLMNEVQKPKEPLPSLQQETNNKLLAQLQEQQKVIALQNLLAQQMFVNPFLQMQMLPQALLNANKLQKPIQPQDIRTDIQYKIPRHSSTLSLKDGKSIQDIKGNVKNAYIKKITSLLNLKDDDNNKEENGQRFGSQQQFLEQEEESSSISEGLNKNMIIQNLRKKGILGSTQDIPNIEYKTRRIKESAKISRLRKKVYINLLEKKITEQQNQINQYKTQTLNSLNYIKKVLSKNDVLSSIIVEQVELMKQIELQTISEQSDELPILLDSFHMRFGTTGTKRKAYLKFCTLNLCKQFISGNYQQLLLGQIEKDVSNDEELNEYIKNFKEIAKVEDDNQTYKVLNFIRNILSHKKSLQKQVKSINKNYTNLKLSLNKFDESVGQVYNILTPVQQAVILKHAENFDVVKKIQKTQQNQQLLTINNI